MGKGSHTTERLLLRDMRIDDAAALTPAWCDPEAARFMDNDFGPRNPAQVQRWAEEAVGAYQQHSNSFGSVIELLDLEQVIGWIGF